MKKHTLKLHAGHESNVFSALPRPAWMYECVYMWHRSKLKACLSASLLFICWMCRPPRDLVRWDRTSLRHAKRWENEKVNQEERKDATTRVSDGGGGGWVGVSLKMHLKTFPPIHRGPAHKHTNNGSRPPPPQQPVLIRQSLSLHHSRWSTFSINSPCPATFP